MDLKLKDKVAIVTGASSGLGKAIALCLAGEGAKVVVSYFRDAEKGIDLAADAGAVVKQIEETHGTEALAAPCDLAQEAEIHALYRMAEERFGQVDILVNNAAYLPTGPMTEITEEEWNYTFQVNVTGAFVAARELVKRLRAADRPGRIVNIVSQAAFRGSTTGHLPYDCSKGAMVSFTLALTHEVARHGIGVNAVAPGMIRTEMVAKTWEKRKEKYLARIPIQRIAETEEVARVVAFLASEAASYMAGATVDVSGGMLLR
jgi:3-oxoacyl-[acyl-carrier protein] reductase